jgi:predicted membrane channel-forming protein YqfA (hemolysin III family)
MDPLLQKVVSISVALVIAGSMVPVGLQAIANSNMTGVEEAVATIFTIVVPILAVVGIALYFYRD